MRFDYDKVDWTFVSRILDENSRRLSRTRSGRSDTGTSALKRPLLLSGEALKEKAKENERAVHQFLFQHRHAALTGAREVGELLFQIADQTNAGLLPEGRFRTWPIEARQRSVDGGAAVSGPVSKIAPEAIAESVDRFCDDLWRRSSESKEESIALAAWAEWELNGGLLHPFYDGCGRISRLFAAALLVKAGEMLPLFEDRATYFAKGEAGAGAFETYYRERISAAALWIGAA
jgi:hypothetical protein